MADGNSLFVVFINLLLIVCYLCPVGCSWLAAIPIPRNIRTRPPKVVPTDGHNEVCRKDRHCQAFEFCHRFERVCMKCRTEGQMCRRNKMCCRGMECASGKCRKKIELGRLGALCTKDRDCNYNLCCARENGQSVCKPMLLEGDSCGIRERGAHFLWSHQCPCSYGLKCKPNKPPARNMIKQLQRDWVGGGKRTCVHPHRISS